MKVETYPITLTFDEWTTVYTALEMYRSQSEEQDCTGQVKKTESIQDAIETQLSNE